MKLSLAWGIFVLASASCSSSLQPRDARVVGDGAGIDATFGDAASSDAAGFDVTVPPGGFITADVDGVTIRAELDAGAYFWSGIKSGWLSAQARNADWIWYVGARNMVDTAAASSASVMLLPVDSMMPFLSDTTGGSAAATVTAAAPNPGDLFEGTFTATLISGTSMTKVVTNGSFHLPRVNGMPPP